MLVCRVCLRPTEKCYRLYTCTNEEGLQIGDIIKLCVPEVDLAISKLPVLCHPCLKLLNASYFFRKLCLTTDHSIGEYVRKGLQTGNHISLGAVVRSMFDNDSPPSCPYRNLEYKPLEPKSLLTSDDDTVPAVVGDQDHEHFDFELGRRPSSDGGDVDEKQIAPPPTGISVKIKSVEMINETAIVGIESASSSAPKDDGFAFKIRSSVSLQEAGPSVVVSPPPLVLINDAPDDPLAIDGVGQSAPAVIGCPSSLKISDEVVVLDDDDDEVQVVEPSRSADPLDTLLKSTPAIESNDVPELVSITRVDPLNQANSRQQRRPVLLMPRTVPDSGSQTKDNEPKPIKVVNPKTNQVQIIGYVLSPGSKDRPVITNSRSNSRYSVQRTQTWQPEASKPAPTVAAVPVPVPVPESKPTVSAVPEIVVPPLTVVTRSAARAKDPTRSAASNSAPASARDNFFSGLKLKQMGSSMVDPFADDDQEDDAFTEDCDDNDPDYVSLQDIPQIGGSGSGGGKQIEEVIVKEEAVDDEGADSSRSQGAKRERTDDGTESSQEGKVKKARRSAQYSRSNAHGDKKLKLLPVVQLQPLNDPLSVGVKAELTDDEAQADSLESAAGTFNSVTAGQTSSQDTSNGPRQTTAQKEMVEVPDFVEIAGRDGEEAQDGTLPAKRQRKPPQRLQQLDSVDESSQENSEKPQQKKRGRPRKKPVVPVPAPEEGGVRKRRGRRKKADTPDPTVMVTEIMKQAGLYHFLSGEDGTEQKKRGKKQKEADKPATGEGIGLFHSLFGDIAGMHTESNDNVDVNTTYEQEQTDNSVYDSSHFENDSSLQGEGSGERLDVTAEHEEVEAEQETGLTTDTEAVSNENENQNSNHSEEANPLENSGDDMSDTTSNQNRPEYVRDSPVPSRSGSVCNEEDETVSPMDGVDQASDLTSNHNQNDAAKDDTETERTVNSRASETEPSDHSVESIHNSDTSLNQDSDKTEDITDVNSLLKNYSGDNIEIVEEEEDAPEFVDPSAC